MAVKLDGPGAAAVAEQAVARWARPHVVGDLMHDRGNVQVATCCLPVVDLGPRSPDGRALDQGTPPAPRPHTVGRHVARLEEQTGRAELIRANVVGRSSRLTVIVALITNAVAALLVFVAMVGVAGFAVTGSLVFAVGIAATGLAFAGVTVVTVQLSEYTRGAAGMAGAVLGAAFLVRAGGDMAAEGGTTLSWFSPLA